MNAPAGSAPDDSYSLALRRAGLFQGVDQESVEALTPEFDTFRAGRGTVLFREGDPGDYLYIILDGKIKLGRRAEDGRESLVALLGPADQFGELSLLDPGPRTATAAVVSDAVLARLGKAALDRWIAQRPLIAAQMLRVVARRLRRTRANATDLIFVDVPGRVAKQLIQLASQFGVANGSEISVIHGLTQIELAQLVGSSRETVNKTLSDYANRGWVRVEKRCIVILDLERLAQRAR